MFLHISISSQQEIDTFKAEIEKRQLSEDESTAGAIEQTPTEAGDAAVTTTSPAAVAATPVTAATAAATS